MKKIVLLAMLLFGFSTLCFAERSIEVFGGVPIMWEEGELLGLDTRAQVTSICFGVGFIFQSQRNDRVAFGMSLELILPQTISMTEGGETVRAGRSDYDTLMGMSQFLGPRFTLLSTDNIEIPLSAGVRWMWLIANQSNVSLFGANIGLGMSLGIDFHINETVYFFGKLRGIYDLWGMTSIEVSGFGQTATATNSGFISSFEFTPLIGIGFSF